MIEVGLLADEKEFCDGKLNSCARKVFLRIDQVFLRIEKVFLRIQKDLFCDGFSFSCDKSSKK